MEFDSQVTFSVPIFVLNVVKITLNGTVLVIFCRIREIWLSGDL